MVPFGKFFATNLYYTVNVAMIGWYTLPPFDYKKHVASIYTVHAVNSKIKNKQAVLPVAVQPSYCYRVKLLNN